MHQTRLRSIFAGMLLALAAHASPPAGTLDIPLTVNEEQRYVVGVNMVSRTLLFMNLLALTDDLHFIFPSPAKSYTPSTQKFKFVLAMNTGYSAVAGTNCTDCDGVPSSVLPPLYLHSGLIIIQI